METTICQHSDLIKYGRMDARFLILAQQHETLVDELLTKLSKEDLRKLAGELPYDSVAFATCFPQYVHVPTQSKTHLESVVAGRVRLMRITDLAVYCACASRSAASKLLTQVAELKKQEIALIKQTKDLVEFSLEHHCKHLGSAIKGIKP